MQNQSPQITVSGSMGSPTLSVQTFRESAGGTASAALFSNAMLKATHAKKNNNVFMSTKLRIFFHARKSVC